MSALYGCGTTTTGQGAWCETCWLTEPEQEAGETASAGCRRRAGRRPSRRRGASSPRSPSAIDSISRPCVHGSDRARAGAPPVRACGRSTPRRRRPGPRTAPGSCAAVRARRADLDRVAAKARLAQRPLERCSRALRAVDPDNDSAAHTAGTRLRSLTTWRRRIEMTPTGRLVSASTTTRCVTSCSAISGPLAEASPPA